MPFDDLQEFVVELENRSDLRRVKREVDPKFEIANVAKKCLNEYGPALLFENVKGSKIPVVTGLAGSVARCLLPFGLERSDLPERWEKTRRNLQPSQSVSSGSCKEIIRTGSEVDLWQYPHIWYSKKDRGYYITTGVIVTKDPDTGIQNAGMYRVLVLGRDKLSICINDIHHGRVNAKKYIDQNKPCPIAIALGTDLAVVQAAALPMPYGIDEIAVAGTLRDKPIKTVKCETVELQVPATSNLVIEGEFIPGTEEGTIGNSVYVDEGPFGEFTGYYGDLKRSPVMRVSAVTGREDMTYHSLVIGMPPTELGFMNAALRWITIYEAVAQILPRDQIRGVHIFPTAYTKCIVSIRKTRPGQGKLVAAAALVSMDSIRKVVVVDDDIDPLNQDEVLWAEETRARFEDYFSFEVSGSELDPISRPGGMATKIGIDATIPLKNDKIGKTEILKTLGPVTFDTEKINLNDYLQ